VTSDNPRVRGSVRWAGILAAMAVLAAGCSAGTSAPTPPGSTSPSSPSAPSAGADQVLTITSADVPMPAAVDPGLSAAAPKRIVSLATGVGETLAALGVADRVVGRDETSDVPAIDAAPVVTKAHSTSAEKVLALSPDLVLIDDATAPPEAVDQIRNAGVRVVSVPSAWTLTDIAARTRAAAEAVGASPAAADAVIAEASATAPSSSTAGPRVAFLYLRGTAAVYLVGGAGSGADSMIEAAGGVDAGAAAGLAAFTPLTAEALAAMNPDVILVMTKGLESVGGVDGLVQLPGVAQTTAGQERHVVAVDDTLLLSFGPRTGALATALHAAFAAEAPATASPS
jgi:iron complex transport system substrate-binding protein